MNKKVLLLLIFTFILFPKLAYAVVFEHDTVYLFENGKKITDSSVIWNSEICFSGVCDIGQQHEPVTLYKTSETNLLPFEQWKTQYYQEHEGCEGYLTYGAEINKLWSDYIKSPEYKELYEAASKEAIAKKVKGPGPYVSKITHQAGIEYIRSKGYSFYEQDICKININTYQQSLKDLALLATKKIVFDPGPATGGMGCGNPCIGGIIGTRRTYNLDIANGKFIQTDKVVYWLKVHKTYLIGFIGLIVLFYIIKKVFIKKYNLLKKSR